MITLINGKPQTPAGLIVPNGSVGFQLNCDATVVAAPFGFISGDIEVVFQFDANGLIQPNAPAAAAQIYSNAELNPQNSTGLATYYLVTFYDANGARINQNPMWWQFPESAGATVDIGEMTPISTVGGNVIFYPTAFGGGGTVTSVAFVGDGTVLSSTPSAPVTTAGNIVATLLTQSANTVLAGPVAGGPAALPTFRALVAADFPAGSILWNNLGNATGNLILANSNFTTTFQQTSSVPWTWQNTVVATGGSQFQSAPSLVLGGNYWTGSASAADTWSFIPTLAGGPTSILAITHVGAPGIFNINNANQINLSLSGTTSVGNFTVTGNANLRTAFGNGPVWSFSSVSVSGNLATYVFTTSITVNAFAGSYVTISGFTNGGNNGRFIIQSISSTQVVVYNAGAVIETHAGAGTVDIAYGSAGFVVSIPGANSFAVAGTTYTPISIFQTPPNLIAIALDASGDATDAGYLRVRNDGATGNHGLEIGGIIDGTGVSPVAIQAGVFNSQTGVTLAQLQAATSGANFNSPSLNWQGSYWTGSVSAADVWSVGLVLGSGANPTTTLGVQHFGSTGTPVFVFKTGVSFTATITAYNNIATVAGGLASEIATVDRTAQSAAIGTTLLYAVPASGAGQYRLQWNAKVTTAAGVSSTLGPLTITYTDPDGVVQTITAQAQSSAGTDETSDTGNTTTSVLLGNVLLLNCKASTNIQYAFAYASNAANAMNYNLHVRLEVM